MHIKYVLQDHAFTFNYSSPLFNFQIPLHYFTIAICILQYIYCLIKLNPLNRSSEYGFVKWLGFFPFLPYQHIIIYIYIIYNIVWYMRLSN